MAKNKTNETLKSVTEFINAVADETKRNDSFSLVELMQKQTGFEAKMWGPSIIGFGSYHYRYESGREGDMPLAAFSPRTSAIVFYLSVNPEKRAALLQSLGKHKTGKGCIYVKKLEDINIEVLKKMVTDSVKNLQSRDSNKEKKNRNKNNGLHNAAYSWPAYECDARVDYQRLYAGSIKENTISYISLSFFKNSSFLRVETSISTLSAITTEPPFPLL